MFSSYLCYVLTVAAENSELGLHGENFPQKDKNFKSVFSYIPSGLNYHKTIEKQEFIIIFIVISIYSKRM